MRTLTSLAARLIVVALGLCAAALPASAQVAFRAAASATTAGVTPAFRAAASATTTGATLTITKPSGVVANDVMIASVGVTPSSTPITPPAGWTLVRRIDNADATSNSLAVYSRVAGGSEPASYDWGVSGVAFAVGGIQAFSGVDTAEPIAIEDGQATPSATGHATPSVTTPVANAMVVTSHTFASSRTWSAPSGMSESFDRPSGANNATGQSIAGARVLQAVAGASGVKTANAAGNADAGNAHILALRPASVNLAIATPAGTVANDVMIAAIGLNHASAVIVPPSGWTLVRRVDNANAPSNSLAVYRRTATAGEPPSHTWAIAGGEFLVGGIQGFSGADPANPLDGENGQSTPSGTTHSTPSVTTTVANAMLVTAHTYASSRSWTPGAGLTEGYDRPSGANSATGQSIAGNYQLQAVAGASGAKAATAAGNADDGNTHILALHPGGAAPSAGLYFIHTDHLNTPRLITNDQGATVWQWDTTDPFGNNAPNENPSGLGNFTCNLRLPGQYFDKETNLHYNMARDYDPAIGRYIQSDPIGLGGGINTYGYVGANPLTRVDSTGQFFFLPFIAAAFGGGGATTGTLAAGSALLVGTAIAIQSSSSGTGGKSASDPFFPPVAGPGTTSSQDVCKPALPDVQPGNLCEQLALTEAKAGAGKPIVFPLGDAPRLEALYGPGPWIKMQHTHRCPDGRLLVIHYFTNGRGLNVELKFV